MITKVLCLFLVVVFSFAMIPLAEAKYQDRSDELPGISDGPSPMLIVAGVLLVATVVVIAVKKSKKSTKAEDKIKSSIDRQLSAASVNSCFSKTDMKPVSLSAPYFGEDCY